MGSPLQNALISHSYDPWSLDPICRMITSAEHPWDTDRLDLRGKRPSSRNPHCGQNPPAIPKRRCYGNALRKDCGATETSPKSDYLRQGGYTVERLAKVFASAAITSSVILTSFAMAKADDRGAVLTHPDAPRYEKQVPFALAPPNARLPNNWPAVDPRAPPTAGHDRADEANRVNITNAGSDNPSRPQESTIGSRGAAISRSSASLTLWRSIPSLRGRPRGALSRVPSSC